MLPQSSAAPQPRRIGVGIDTARYGHYAVFLHEDLQPDATELAVSALFRLLSGSMWNDLRSRRNRARRQCSLQTLVALHQQRLGILM
jgi:hypothetical protein